MARKQGDFKFKSKDPQLQLKAAKTRRSSGSDSSEVLERQMQRNFTKATIKPEDLGEEWEW